MFTKIQAALYGLLAVAAVAVWPLFAEREAIESALSALEATAEARDSASSELIDGFAETDRLIDQFHVDQDQIAKDADAIRAHLAAVRTFADSERSKDAASGEELAAIVSRSRAQVKETQDTLDVILAKKLGDPIGQTFGKRATIKVFSLKEVGYQGYMAKVKLHDPSAVRLVMASPLGDDLGSPGETVLSMAKRTGGVLAINAGGFFAKGNRIYPIGNTVSDGKLISQSSNQAVSFIGFNREGRLVGGPAMTPSDIERLGVREGASFLPTLIKDGKAQAIPKDWAGKKEPRTLIGHFTNGDVLMIVIDGRQKGYSEGVTLEDAQTKLLGLNIRDAYNLDGGGSSTFVYNGQVLNRPSDGKPRPVISSFVIFP
ncbi:MAG: phosphodiester glycosidase family protein [Hydrogenibacillus sp.]|nr:phosphodiester glycosidase family protein [Hydrogenibacillus sp.]